MNIERLTPGATFPNIEVLNNKGECVPLVNPISPEHWTMVVVYRGVHCPVCTKYLTQLQEMRTQFQDIKVDIVAVSADTVEQLNRKLDDVAAEYPVYAGLSMDYMKQLGLFVSDPRSDAETDHPFPEPGLFIINSDNKVQIIEIANSPFVRPDLNMLVSGLGYTRKNDYPIRGTKSI
ncbi:redoxin domain-containing protein [Paraglaciecola sp. 20A4]|uniref:redoxin domain-containing protein n=1 Tax=Paraglaciecola sp. 20A4 TaxID=2687288 RepID=UPI00140CD464|nr:redoxin domain-containing protein [Paraglaciecola sp. 20A4]